MELDRNEKTIFQKEYVNEKYFILEVEEIKEIIIIYNFDAFDKDEDAYKEKNIL